LELRHLRVLIVLSEELHFGRTAARLHVAQSAVSQTIRDLEDEIELRLVERTSRHVKLTEAGRVFLSHALESVRAAETGKQAARAAHAERSHLRVRLLASATPEVVPAQLGRLRIAEPETLIEVRDGTSAQNVEALESARCDVALASLASRHRLGAGYEHSVLVSSPLAIAMPTRHPLAGRKSVELGALRGVHVLHLQRDDEPAIRAALDARLAAVGAVSTAIAVSHPHALLALVAAGLGVAILPVFVAREMRGVRVVPISGIGAKGGVIAVWNARRASAVTQRFVARLEAERTRAS
jgi:DNA-binding transcriptional LysR family regulator